MRCQFSNSIVKQPLTPLSSSGLTGRSSIPEAAVLQPRGRGVLDARFRGHDSGETCESIPAALSTPESCVTITLFRDRGRREGRVAAAPGAAAQKNLRERAKTTGTGGISPAFPARWFTAYFALSSVNQLVATVIRAMRKAHRRQLGACMGAPGPHDFAVRK